MGAVVSFEERRFQRLAADFVDVYTKEGRVPAGHFLAEHVPSTYDQQTLEPYVREEFINRGYLFPDEEYIV